MTVPREPSPTELAEDLAELKSMVVALGQKMDELPFVRQDLYSARHHALRNEITAEMARIHLDIQAEASARERAIAAVEATAGSARQLAVWAVGLICTAVIGGIVTYALAAGGG